MNVTGLTRLIPTECEVGGWPPLSVTFSSEEDRREVLGRSGSLITDRNRVLHPHWSRSLEAVF